MLLLLRQHRRPTVCAYCSILPRIKLILILVIVLVLVLTPLPLPCGNCIDILVELPAPNLPVQHPLSEKRDSLFECFRYVCPEPVLAK
jgi:hypothetical protein